MSTRLKRKSHGKTQQAKRHKKRTQSAKRRITITSNPRHYKRHKQRVAHRNPVRVTVTGPRKKHVYRRKRAVTVSMNPMRRHKRRKHHRRSGFSAFIGSNPMKGGLFMSGLAVIVGYVAMRLASDGIWWAMGKVDPKTRRIVLMVVQPLLLLFAYWGARKVKSGWTQPAWLGAFTYTGMSIAGNVVSLASPDNCADNAACVTAKAIFPDFLAGSFKGQLSARSAGVLIDGHAAGALYDVSQGVSQRISDAGALYDSRGVSQRISDAGAMIDTRTGAVRSPVDQALIQQTAQHIMDEAKKAGRSGALILDESGRCMLTGGMMYDTVNGVLIDTTTGATRNIKTGNLMRSDSAGEIESDSSDENMRMFLDCLVSQPPSTSAGALYSAGALMSNSLLR